MEIPRPLRVHGLNLSYFTGKLEGYLRAQAINYELIEMDTRDFNACAKATGVAQMPQVEWSQGQWLTDTTLILEFLDRGLTDETSGSNAKVSIYPNQPLMRFIALLIEDFSDEWLWGPALYYRWANPLDARLMGQRLALGMLRDVPLPTFTRRWAITKRQQLHFLWLDGYRTRYAHAIEADFIETLDALEAIFQSSPFVLGNSPSIADFALFGPFFRHFCADPTPTEVVRQRAPATLAWTAKMWGLKLDDFRDVAQAEYPSEALQALLTIIQDRFLPWMQANYVQVQQGRKFFTAESHGCALKRRTSTYRAWRFQRLKQRYAEIIAQKTSNTAKELALLMPQAEEFLSKNDGQAVRPVVNHLPIIPAQSTSVASRIW